MLKKQTLKSSSSKPLSKGKRPSKSTTLRSSTGTLSLKPRKRRAPRSLEQKTAQELQKEADKWFSRKIRLRDSRLEDGVFTGTCITCSKNGRVAWYDEEGKLRFVKGWDNGHFIGRGTKVLRYNEQNCNLQCSFRCNKMRSGEHEKYKGAIDDKFGKGSYRKLENIAAKYPVYSLKKPELLEIIYECKEEVASYELVHMG